MNLKEFMMKSEAKKCTIDSIHPYLKLSISDKGSDRFESNIVLFDDEPNVIYVIRHKMSGLRIISNTNVLNNFNDLHTNFKTAYKIFITELKASNIDFILNETNE